MLMLFDLSSTNNRPLAKQTTRKSLKTAPVPSILDITLKQKRRAEEFNLRQRLKAIRKNIKNSALFFLAFSLFIILNDCVGLSSAPFYSTHVHCKLVEPSAECQTLRTLAKVIYLSEMVAGFMLSVQSILLYYVNDNFSQSFTSFNPKKKIDTAKIKRVIKGLLTAYLVILALRVFLYN